MAAAPFGARPNYAAAVAAAADGGPYFDGEHERPDMIGAYYGSPYDAADDGGGAELRLRDRHPSFRTGANARLQRGPSAGPRSPSATAYAAGAVGVLPAVDEGGLAAAAARKFRRRWDDSAGGNSAREDDARCAGADGSPQTRTANTGHLVRMRRSEAWGKFLAYEGSCQVCMMEGAKGVAEASYFLSSGCAPLRTGLGISSLLLPAVLPAHLAASDGGSIDLGNEIVWDDCDSDKRLSAAAYVNRMSVIKLRVAKLALSSRGGWWSKLTCKRGTPYSDITVHMRMTPVDPLAPIDMRFRLGSNGVCLPGSPMYELQPDYGNRDIVLEVSDGYGVVARGAVSCKRLWQIGMEHAPLGEGDEGPIGYPPEEEPSTPATDGGQAGPGGAAGPGGICSWFRDDAQVPLRAGATGIWVSVFGEGGSSGQVLLSIARVQREMPSAEGLGDGGAGAVLRGNTLKVSACQAYDYLLMAALRAQMCDENRLEVGGEWAWLLTAFAGHYGVRSNYAIMSHLRWVLKPGVASVSRPCFELLARQLHPLLAQESMGGSLTQQESTMLTRIKRDAEELLKLCFENYHLLSSSARKGILEATAGLTNQPAAAGSEFPPDALVAGMALLEVMRDVFLPSDAEWLTDRFRIAAKSRWARLAMACDDGAAGADGTPPANPLLAAPLRKALSGKTAGGASPTGKAAALYSKMAQVAAAIVQDIEYDRRLQDVPRLLPSALSLPAITAAEYCANYVTQLRSVLGQAPPHQPTEVAIDMLVSVAGLQRYLEENGLALPKGTPGCIDALELFGHHVRSWLTNSQEGLCAAARSLEATTELSATTGLGATSPAAPAGGSEEGGVAPIVHEMLRAVVNEMHRYERVICHWPVFGPHLEASLCCVLRSIMSAVSRQCGMTRVRGGAGGADSGLGGLGGSGGGHGGASPHRNMRVPSAANYGPGPETGGRASRLAVAAANQWAWAADSPRRPGGERNSAPRCLLMVREAALLNSLKRLMVAVPSYEASINRWSGGPAAVPPGPPASPTRPAGAPANAAGNRGGGFDPYGYSDDVAPHVGAQFAQVVKELRTEYAAAVGAVAERVSQGLAASSATSVRAILAAAKHAVASAGANPSALQQQAMMEGLAEPLFRVLEECLANLQAALDSRVFVAVGRGLWDFIGRQLYEFIEQLQEGVDHKGAWRSRQNASLLLGLINAFFKGGLMAHMEHGLQDRDLSVPLHIDACLKLLASNTTALNSSFTPF